MSEWPDDDWDSAPVTGGPPVLRVVGEEDEDPFERDAKGTIRNTVPNAAVALVARPEWNGLRWNKFTRRAEVRNPPPLPGFDPPREQLDEYAGTYIAQWLAKRTGVKLSPSDALKAAEVASKAKGRSYHPVREWLRGLEWDGVPRVDRWLARYLGSEQGLYTAAVGAMWLRAAVARVMQPGCVSKSMIILEGGQDAGKSTALRALVPFPEWFSDSPIELGSSNADKYQTLRGKWIYEIAELDAFKGKEATRIKSYVSSPVDNYRASYGRTNEDVPRQCVFAGTTNEKHYFHDETGNVRFWPVAVCVSGAIDVGLIEREREQIWAEAVADYLDGKPWHITDKRIAELARAETEKRTPSEAWVDALSSWVLMPANRADLTRGMSTTEVLTRAFGVPLKEQRRGEEMRCGRALRAIGCEVDEGVRPRIYRLAPVRDDDEIDF